MAETTQSPDASEPDKDGLAVTPEAFWHQTKSKAALADIGFISRLRWASRHLSTMRAVLSLLLMRGPAINPGALLPQRSQNPAVARIRRIDTATVYGRRLAAYACRMPRIGADVRAGRVPGLERARSGRDHGIVRPRCRGAIPHHGRRGRINGLPAVERPVLADHPLDRAPRRDRSYRRRSGRRSHQVDAYRAHRGRSDPVTDVLLSRVWTMCSDSLRGTVAGVEV